MAKDEQAFAGDLCWSISHWHVDDSVGVGISPRVDINLLTYRPNSL